MPENPSRPQSSPPSSSVPPGIRAASEWSWRLLLIVAGVAVFVYGLTKVSELAIPIAVALLLTAMLRPLWKRMAGRIGPIPAAGVTVAGTIIVILALLYLVGRQFASGWSDVTRQLVVGLEQIRDWIHSTFQITDTQFTEFFENIRDQLLQSGDLGGTAANIGLTATHFVAGMFIALFALFFFLYDGPRIFAWVTRLFPQNARAHVVSSGGVAWRQLSSFVRAAIIVAAVDAIGIAVGAAILRVPFALAIGVLVFLLSFIPIVGALLSGAVAVVLALVAHGPGVALIMLAVVIGVQQLESHVLQPLLLGKAVSVHPLAVVLSIAAGASLAGIVGALLAVPLAAVGNAVLKHLLSKESEGELEPEAPALPPEPAAPPA